MSKTIEDVWTDIKEINHPYIKGKKMKITYHNSHLTDVVRVAEEKGYITGNFSYLVDVIHNTGYLELKKTKLLPKELPPVRIRSIGFNDSITYVIELL